MATATWDDPGVMWDDPNVTWDGAGLPTPVPTATQTSDGGGSLSTPWERVWPKPLPLRVTWADAVRVTVRAEDTFRWVALTDRATAGLGLGLTAVEYVQAVDRAEVPVLTIGQPSDTFRIDSPKLKRVVMAMLGGGNGWMVEVQR